MDYNSIKNQAIKRKFVEREVKARASMVEYILQKSYEDNNAPFTFEDLENYYIPVCPQCGERSLITETEEDLFYTCSFCNTKFVEAEEETQEVYEWWIVSKWLLEKLKAKGEVVIAHENIWGRTCTGQAIFLDHVISEICNDLEILEGQKNEWKV